MVRAFIAGSVVGAAVLFGAPGTPVASSTASAAADAGAGDAGSLPGCVGVTTESRYVPYGYNHLVVVANGCSKAATCSVSTDVSPAPYKVEVASLKSVEVLTFSGSPAQTFVARVTCTLSR